MKTYVHRTHIWGSIDLFLEFMHGENNSSLHHNNPKENVSGQKDMDDGKHTYIENYIICKENQIDLFLQLPLMVNAKIFLILDQEGLSMNVLEVFSPNIVPGKEPNKIQNACFSFIGSPICDPMRGIWERRKSLDQVHLRALFEPARPFAYYDNWKLQGIFPALFLEVQKYLNFSYDQIRSPDGMWGTKQVL